ncbi:MAG: transglutaminase family protein [Yoonia sp.]|nr:transglutaminase family protein [Yoonia sp.]
MLLRIQSHLHYTTTQPCSVLVQIEAAHDAHQTVQSSSITLSDDNIIAGQDGVGTRRWVQSGAKFQCDYNAVVQINRPIEPIHGLIRGPLHTLPSDATAYLMASRYCQPEPFFDIVGSQFGNLSGGARIAAMSAWIKNNFTYDISASNALTSASDSLAQKAGVCRDYAHVLIAMARAAAIPARFVSCYAPDVSPQDFHAVTEVYLDGAWHIVDPTGMADPAKTVRIGVGHDAADVSFMTSFGWMDLVAQTVNVTEINVQ